jgi:hypothetical protein
MTYQVWGSGVAYDTTKDKNVKGDYRTQGVYDSSMAREGKVKPDEVRWRTLYNGLMEAQKDGYEYAWITGPTGISLRRSVSSSGSSTSHTTHTWPGFAYTVHAYKADDKTGETRPASARPIAGLIDEANRRAHAAKPATN